MSRIIIDCERMKYPYTGLYEYCKQLCNALINTKDPLFDKLSFYVPKNEIGFAGAERNYIMQKSFHKFFNPSVFNSDIWHCTYQGSMYFPKNTKVKKILTIHDLNFLFDENKGLDKQKKYLAQIQKKINSADQLTVISNFTLDCLKQHLSLNNKPVEVIYNGCIVNTEETFSSKPVFINENDQFLFSLGTIASKKNFHVLPALLKGNEFKLVISGIVQDQDYYNKILFEAKRHNVEDRLILSGPISEAEKWWLMRNTIGFLFPSLAEGFGIPVVEAMNFGIPVFLSTHTSLPEIGQNAAYYFNSFDPDSMQQTLYDSLSHFENEKNQKDIVLKRASDFNWVKSAEAYLKIYKQLLNN